MITQFIFSTVFSLFFAGICSSAGLPQSSCPKLPSGKCWVDCTFSMHQILCEEVDYFSLHGDLKAYDEALQQLTGNFSLSLAIWNSPELMAVETNALHHLEKYLVYLTVQNLQGLLFFPMLRGFPRLEQVHLNNCPKVTELDLTILPPSITHLTLLQTGVQRLANRLSQRLILPELVTFTFQENPITYIQGGYFLSFPKLQYILMSGNSFTLEKVDADTFTTVLPIAQFYFSNNYFFMPNGGYSVNQAFFNSIFCSTKLDKVKANFLDLSFNGLTISPAAAGCLASNFTTIKNLKLRGNPFDASVQTSGLFQNFKELVNLDLGYTTLVPGTGIFKGTDKLATLSLDGNGFRGALEGTDIFKDLNSADFRTLNLANNGLREFPSGYFAQIRAKMIEMDLSDNEMQFPELTGASAPSSLVGFSKLEKLSLRNNKLTSFQSVLLEPLGSLQELDMSCNELRSIDKNTFARMPATLQWLNMSFCPAVPYSVGNHPAVADDAFTALKSVANLFLANGMLGEEILTKVDKLPNKQNKMLNLDNNGIRTIETARIQTLNLTYLSLKNNQIHEILPVGATFAVPSFSNLQTLVLSNNQITSIKKNDLTGLTNLKSLFLENNQMINIASGVFDQLPALAELYLRDNLLSSVHHFFDQTGDQLRGFMFERNRITNISRVDFSRLKNLNRLYLYGNPVETIEDGSFDVFDPASQTTIALPSNDLACDCRNNWLRNYIKQRNFHNFFSLFFEDPENPFGSIAASHVPKCRYPDGISNFVTEPFRAECGSNGGSRLLGSKAFGITFTVIVSLILSIVN